MTNYQAAQNATIQDLQSVLQKQQAVMMNPHVENVSAQLPKVTSHKADIEKVRAVLQCVENTAAHARACLAGTADFDRSIARLLEAIILLQPPVKKKKKPVVKKKGRK